MVKDGVTVVPEAAFQDPAWRRGLEPPEIATIKVIHCEVDAGDAPDRNARRVKDNIHRAAHDDQGLLQGLAIGARELDAFVPVSLPVSRMRVDTTA